jgi:DNA polymerase III delta prime subunit
MKGAILLFGGTEGSRNTQAKEFIKSHVVDTLEIVPLEDKKSIGIEQVRQAQSFLSKRPLSSEVKSIFIPHAEILTVDAQNALLKTLEEPPIYGVIILATKNEENLLPTVISRCQRISCGKNQSREEQGSNLTGIDMVKKMSVDEIFSWAQETAKEEKPDVINMLESWVRTLRVNLNKEKAGNIEKILEVIGSLEKTNVNVRLALEYLVLGIKQE